MQMTDRMLHILLKKLSPFSDTKEWYGYVRPDEMKWLIENGAKNPNPEYKGWNYWVKDVATGKMRGLCFYFIPSGEILRLLLKWHPNEPSLL
jgi:hypothetical protein